jgi:hypothetical protein
MVISLFSISQTLGHTHKTCYITRKRTICEMDDEDVRKQLRALDAEAAICFIRVCIYTTLGIPDNKNYSTGSYICCICIYSVH